MKDLIIVYTQIMYLLFFNNLDNFWNKFN